MPKEHSCVFCKKWMNCERTKHAEEIWKLPPKERDLKWTEIAFECQEFE